MARRESGHRNWLWIIALILILAIIYYTFATINRGLSEVDTVAGVFAWIAIIGILTIYMIIPIVVIIIITAIIWVLWKK